MEIAPLLQGMLDAGVPALPSLSCVHFDNSAVGGLDNDLLRRFMHKFSETIVRFEFSHDLGGHLLTDHYELARRFGRWPRVEVEPEPTDDPPSPHSSDDESESEVEVEEEPA